MAKRGNEKKHEWIPTICGRCYGGCGIKVLKVDGVPVRIEGQPNSTQGSEGGLCAKGISGLQVLHDPNRLNKPLKRTNPEKGLYADPKWKEITWEEAFDEIVPRLKEVLESNSRKFLFQFTTIRPPRHSEILPFLAVLGPYNIFLGGGGLHCGQGAHPMAGMVHGSWSVVPDFRYCNYALYFGANKGSGSGHSAMVTTRQAADARSRGMKFVVFDPTCNFSGGKANEWVPIIPGTDGVVVLSICNEIVNSLHRYDAEYIRTKTNGSYLIGPDGHYVRENGPARGVPGVDPRIGKPVTYIGDDDTNKPLVWDAKDGKAKVFDDPTIGEYALTGEYEVNGVSCKPAFEKVKEHLTQYSPEMASEISSVPPEVIRKIADEFSENAKIGSTIELDGHKLPFRPASAVLFRGGEGHENSHQTCFAVALLNALVGNCDVPGGTLGWPAKINGYPETGKINWGPVKGVDGFLTVDHFGATSGAVVHGHGPWPVALPEKSNHLGMTDIFTLAPFPFVFGASDQEEIWEKLGIDYRIEMMMVLGCNSVISTASPEILDKALKKIPFIFTFELFNTELTEGYTDIVLPDTCYLEETNWTEGLGLNFNHPFGMDDWSYHMAQRVVEPKEERREFIDVIYELADRLGKREELNQAINRIYGLKEPNNIQDHEKLTIAEVSDRAAKDFFGSEHDLKWFRENGFLRWSKSVDEVYWRHFTDARTPIYLEYLLDVKTHLKKISDECDLGVDFIQYDPLISWFPCTIHRPPKSGYEYYCYSYRDVLHTGSGTMEQPWLDEASRMNPYTYNITVNADTAKSKGIEDGDIIEIESVYGKKVKGPVKTMEGQHPRLVGIAACSGHWAKGMPIARGKGTNFDTLLELDLEHCDPISLNMETAVRVKIAKVRGEKNG